METILSISYIFAQLWAKESLWWVLPEVPRSRLQAPAQRLGLEKSLACTPGALREHHLLLTSHYCFQLKAIRELFFLWANTRGVPSCQGRDQLLLMACSFTRIWLMMPLQTLWSGSQGQAASEKMTWPFTCQSPASHSWGHCPRPCNLQMRGGICWRGVCSRTAVLWSSLPPSLMQPPNITVPFMVCCFLFVYFFYSRGGNWTILIYPRQNEAKNLAQDQQVASSRVGIGI